jgi:uncharacterized tellurite resistance protein B-like protein
VSPEGAPSDLGQWSRYRSLYVLAKREGVGTNVQRAIESAHCPGCGAPESDLASHACEYCGAVLNTGDYDWTLVDADFFNTPKAKQWLDKLLAAPQPVDFEEVSRSVPSPADALAWMINMLAADGEIHPEERLAVLQIAKKAGMDVPEPMVDGLIHVALKGELDAPPPPDLTVGRKWMELMADVALVDGLAHPSEEKVLVALGSSIGLTRADVVILINKRRVQQFES